MVKYSQNVACITCISVCTSIEALKNQQCTSFEEKMYAYLFNRFIESGFFFLSKISFSILRPIRIFNHIRNQLFAVNIYDHNKKINYTRKYFVFTVQKLLERN